MESAVSRAFSSAQVTTMDTTRPARRMPASQPRSAGRDSFCACATSRVRRSRRGTKRRPMDSVRDSDGRILPNR